MPHVELNHPLLQRRLVVSDGDLILLDIKGIKGPRRRARDQLRAFLLDVFKLKARYAGTTQRL